MKIHLLSGFLGSGKTTAIQQASRFLLQQDIKVGVITNDQGIKLVDAGFFESLNIPGRQVANGCFCCNYNDLDKKIESLIETINPEVIFAESVGSCTDIVATVMKPILLFRKEVAVSLSVFADARLLYILLQKKPLFEEEVNYIYFKQLEEAGIIAISKIDLVSQEELQFLKLTMKEKYGSKKLVYLNSLDNNSSREWIVAISDSFQEAIPSLDIDYDMYGAGEAKLAWLDQVAEIYQPDHAATVDAIELIKSIYDKIRQANYAIGHLKFLLNGKHKISYTSTFQEKDFTGIDKESRGIATLIINARVQTNPDRLSAIVEAAMQEIQERTACAITVSGNASFQPGYPRPTHRITS